MERCSRREFPSVAVTGISGEQRRQALTHYYRHNWDRLLSQPGLSFWLDEVSDSWMVALHRQREALTAESQALIWDWAGNPETCLPGLSARAKQEGDLYLVVQQLLGQAHRWSELGFAPELRRVISPTGTEPWESQDFEVREAEARDVFFIANLHLQAGPFYLPAQRSVDRQAVLGRSFNHYLGLRFSPQGPMRGFVLLQRSQPLGYILYRLPFKLEISGAQAAYLYDLNLRPEAWGRSAAGILGRFSLECLRRDGIQFVVGDISCDNQQAYRAATRAGHFQAESERWGLRL